MPAAFKLVETVSRRMCTARSIRLRDQPSRPSARTLLFVFFAQDIHRRRIILRLSHCPGSAVSLAAFQVSTDGRFWVSPEVQSISATFRRVLAIY